MPKKSQNVQGSRGTPDNGSIIAHMQEYYSKRAGIYDSSMGYDDPKVRESMIPVIELLQTLVHGRSVLELACGPCFWTGQISSAASSIMATDFNASTLEMARRKSLDWDKITLREADAYNLPAFPVRFEACLAVDWFAHVPRSRFHGFLHGLHQKLSDDAVVVFCDRLPHSHEEVDLCDAEDNHLQLRTLPDGARYRVIKHFLDDDGYRSTLSRYSGRIDIDRFPDCRRVVVRYRVTAG